MITLGAVIYAKKSLLANDAPRILVTNYQEKISRNDDDHFEARVRVKNFGNGVAVKTFLLFITDDRGVKHYFLSKPIVSLESKCEAEAEIILSKDDISHEMINSISDKKKPAGAFLISQDFFNNLYYSFISLAQDDSHLKDFSVPIRQVSKFHPIYRFIRGFIKKANKQKNTYTHRIGRKNSKMLKELEQMMGGNTNI